MEESKGFKGKAESYEVRPCKYEDKEKGWVISGEEVPVEEVEWFALYKNVKQEDGTMVQVCVADFFPEDFGSLLNSKQSACLAMQTLSKLL